MLNTSATSAATARSILRYLALAVILLMIARAGATVLRRPCVGVADNLDYWRVAEPAGIRVEPERRQGSYMTCEFPLAEPGLASSLTTPSLIAWLVRGSGQEDAFDIRRLGFCYWLISALILIGAFAAGASALYVLLSAWVLYDPGFLLFFNSFYADPALILGLLAVVFLLLLDRSRPARVVTLALLAVSAAGAGFSKMQYAPFPAVLLACCLLAFAFRRALPGRREAVFLSSLLVVAVLAPLYFFHGPAPRFLDANNYNAVFGGIARVSTHPVEALAAVGIPEEHRQRPAQDYFAAEVDESDPVLPSIRELSRLRLAALYVTDRQAFAKTARTIHEHLGRVRTHPRGTLTRAEGGRRARPYQTPGQFSLWRTRALAPLGLWSHFLLGAVALFLSWRAWRASWSAADTVFLFLLLWIVSQFAVAVLGEGFVNLHQHLLGARLGLDLLIAFVLGRILLRALAAMSHSVADLRGDAQGAPGSRLPLSRGAGGREMGIGANFGSRAGGGASPPGGVGGRERGRSGGGFSSRRLRTARTPRPPSL